MQPETSCVLDVPGYNHGILSPANVDHLQLAPIDFGLWSADDWLEDNKCSALLNVDNLNGLAWPIDTVSISNESSTDSANLPVTPAMSVRQSSGNQVTLETTDEVTGKRRYQCSELGCHGSFTEARSLKRHSQTSHSQARPILCPQPGCEFAQSGFKRKDNFLKHYRRKHEATGL